MNNETRTALIEKNLEHESERVSELKQRVDALDDLRSTLKAIVIVAAIFGISGLASMAYFYKKTDTLNKRLEGLTSQVSTNAAEIKANLDRAISQFDIHASNSTKATLTEFQTKIAESPIFRAGKVGVKGGDTTDTGIPVSDYILTISAFDAGKGDIEEHDPGRLLYVLPCVPKGSKTWHIAANFRTHKVGETWTIYYVALRRDLTKGAYAPPPP